MHLTHPRLSLLAVALALTAAAAGAQTETHGNVTFKVPAGYKLTRGDDGLVRLRLEQERDFLEIRIPMGVPLRGTVDGHLDAWIAEVQKNNPEEFRIDVPKRTQKADNAEQVGWVMVSAVDRGAPKGYSNFLVWCYQAGGRVETLVVHFSSHRIYESQRKPMDRFLNGLRFASAEELAPGEPPLTRFAYERTAGFVEWLLEVPMTAGQRQQIRAAMIEAWQKADRETIDSTTELIDGVDQLASKSTDEKRVVRTLLRDQALAEWRESTEPVEQMLVGVWDAANKPLVKGKPPLTRQVCEATAEAYFLMACAVAGTSFKQPGKELLEKWQALLVERYPDLPEEFRKGFQLMPTFAAALRVAWADMPKSEKDALIEQWKGIKGIPELGQQLAAESMQDLLSRQAQRQAMLGHYQMMSNILRMTHETNMIIASNMGGNTRYVYRY